jgi:hypothetical protein
MTIGGMRITEAQFGFLSKLLKHGRGLSSDPRTREALMARGLIEWFVPDADSYAMAARGRVRYCRLTKAGVEAARGLQKLYKPSPTTKAIPVQPVRRVRQRIVDT